MYDYFTKNSKDYSDLYPKIDINDLRLHFNNMTKDLYRNASNRNFAYEEVNNCLVATLEVPGYSLETLEVSIEDGQLVATGTPPEGVRVPPVKSVLHIVPELLDVGSATASVKNGILSVSIPRKQKDIKSNKIKVKFS